MVKIQIVSDTHLEFRGENFQKLIKPSAPILFLLGDICACGTTEDFDIYKKFMTFLAPKFKYIFHVPGNHEYYTVGNRKITTKDTVPGIDVRIRKFVKDFKNVYFLNLKSVSSSVLEQMRLLMEKLTIKVWMIHRFKDPLKKVSLLKIIDIF